MRYLLLVLILVSCASTNNEEQTTKKKASIYYGYGTQKLLDKDYTAALKHLIEADKLDPNNSNYINNLGMAYFFKKRPKTALKLVKRAVELDGKNTQARLNLATIYMELKNYAQAKLQYNQVLEDLTFDQQYRTYFNLGVLANKQKRYSEAVSFFKQSLSENNNYCPSHFQIGQINFNKGYYENALKHFRNASKGTCYDNPEPLYMQALCQLKLNQFSDARSKLEDIVGRFTGTKIAKDAQRKLQVLNMRIRKYEAKLMRGEVPDGKILTPDF